MSTHGLSHDELARYHRDGFAGPFELCSEDEMGAARAKLEKVLDGTILGETNIPVEDRDTVHFYFWKHWHLYSKTVHDIVTRPQLVQRMQSILGDDLLLWKTIFFKKNPESASSVLPWHQGFPYFSSELDPCVVLSAVIAVDEQTETNGRIEVARGCHHAVYPHHTPVFKTVFPVEIDASVRLMNTNASHRGNPRYFQRVEDFEAIGFSLKPGQFIIFNQCTPHRSAANVSGQRRLGLTARFTIPTCRVMYDPPTRDLGLLPVAGCKKPDALNKYALPPTEDAPVPLPELKRRYLDELERMPRPHFER